MTKQEVWIRAYCASLTGSGTEFSSHDLAKMSARDADLATEQFEQRFLYPKQGYKSEKTDMTRI
jgi:hypothetical protein